MTETTLPDPMVPPEVDLRDFGFMPLDVRTLLTSSLWIKAKKDPRVAHAAVSLWCECWHQVPAASLPDDDEVLADLARCDAKEWSRIRDRALLHFVKCSDGRLYHRHVASKALESWEAKKSQRARTAAATAAREAKRRSEQEARDVQRNAQRDEARDVERDEVRDVHQGTGTGTGTGTKEKEESAQSVPRPQRAPDAGRTDNPQDADQGADPPLDGHSPTQAGSVCKAMRQAGLQQTNPGDPRLLALLEQGATEAEFSGLAAEAARGGKGFAWVLVALQNRRAEAAAIALSPPTAKPGEASGKLPEFVAPPAMTPEERARSEAARKAAMGRLGRVAS